MVVVATVPALQCVIIQGQDHGRESSSCQKALNASIQPHVPSQLGAHARQPKPHLRPDDTRGNSGSVGLLDEGDGGLLGCTQAFVTQAGLLKHRPASA